MVRGNTFFVPDHNFHITKSVRAFDLQSCGLSGVGHDISIVWFFGAAGLEDLCGPAFRPTSESVPIRASADLGDTYLVFDLVLNVVNCVGPSNFENVGLTSKSLDQHLHRPNVVKIEGLYPGEDGRVYHRRVWGPSFRLIGIAEAALHSCITSE
ncbi:hypothetical protein Tco_0999460 [Tanacetum coccineum]